VARSRWSLTFLTLTVIAGGLGSRRPFMPALVQHYVGDVLWGVMFFLLFALVFPGRSSLFLAGLAIVVTELIELSELYQAPWAMALRATRVGGLLLGHEFSWSDVGCVLLGGGLAGGVDARLRATSPPAC
jgi:hypothetical protein